MKFDVIEWALNPFVLVLVSVIGGMLLGKIKLGRFSLGVSGTLFSGLLIGWWAVGYAGRLKLREPGHKAAEELLRSGVVPEELFTLFLILFIAAVGLLASKDLGAVLKRYGGRFIIMGLIITFTGAASTYAFARLSAGSNPYEVAGVYTGALTSSPGLAAALEAAKEHSAGWADRYAALNPEEKHKFLRILDPSGKQVPGTQSALTPELKRQFVENAQAAVGTGHSVAYPFGVIVVILAVNFLPKLFRINVEEEKRRFREEMAVTQKKFQGNESGEGSFDVVAFTAACFFGFTIGNLKIPIGPLGDFSLGSTGGVLIGSLILGYIGRLGFMNFRMDTRVLGIIRQLSLAFFLAIVGLKYGFMTIDSLNGSGLYLIAVALLVGFAAVLAGFAVGRYLFKINWVMLSGAICGGMTSTPGLGAAIDSMESDEPAAGYGAIYPFALLWKVLFTITLHHLPF